MRACIVLLTDCLSTMFAGKQYRMDVGGKAVSPGRVLFVRSSTHLHQEDSVMVGEDLVYSLTVTLL